MIQKLKKSSGNIIGFKLHGKLTDDEFNTFAEEINAAITDKGKVRLLMIVDYPQEFEFKAAWDDLVFWVKHIRNIERLAIAGQKEWEKWLVLLEKPFINTEVKYFKKSNTKDAWDWIKAP